MENAQHVELNACARELIRCKARQLVGSYGFTWDDCEDLMQEITLDVLTRLQKFDPDKARLSTFVTRIVAHRVATLIRYATQAKRDYRRVVCSLDAPIADSDGADGATLGETISQDEHDLRTRRRARPEVECVDLRLDVSLAIEALPADLKLLALRLQFQSIAQAARDLGVSRSSLYETGLARLRRAFEDKDLREYL